MMARKQYLPLIEYALCIHFQNTEEVQQEIQQLGGGVKGECRARRAGSILDISSDGYYKTNKCKEDFVKVCLFKNVEQIQIANQDISRML